MYSHRRFTILLAQVVLGAMLAVGCTSSPSSPESDEPDPPEYGTLKGTLRVRGAIRDETFILSAGVGYFPVTYISWHDMTWIGTYPGEQYWSRNFTINNISPGIVVLRISLWSDPNNPLAEIDTIGDSPIVITAGQTTQIGTVEVVMP